MNEPLHAATTRVLLFQSRFAAMVASGTKCQTIRPIRKRPIWPGDRLLLRTWTGKPYRSPQKDLREAVCTDVQAIHIDETHSEYVFSVGGQELDVIAWALLSRKDGFACTSDLMVFFREVHGLPFDGVLIRWAP